MEISNQERFVINKISKQIQDTQYNTIEKLIQLCVFPNMKVVEIGSWTGLSAVIIGTVIKRVLGKLVSIDWYQGDEIDDGHLRGIAKQVDVPSIFRNNIKYYGLEDTVELRIMTSKEASKSFEDESLDFVFLDGSHIPEAVIEDSNLWYPKLKKGSILAGHDFSHCPETILSLFPEVNVEMDIWWIKKNYKEKKCTITK